jgi:hypothetical protein
MEASPASNVNSLAAREGLRGRGEREREREREREAHIFCTKRDTVYRSSLAYNLQGLVEIISVQSDRLCTATWATWATMYTIHVF